MFSADFLGVVFFFLELDERLDEFANFFCLFGVDVDVFNHRALEFDAVDNAALLDKTQGEGSVQKIINAGSGQAQQQKQNEHAKAVRGIAYEQHGDQYAQRGLQAGGAECGAEKDGGAISR